MVIKIPCDTCQCEYDIDLDSIEKMISSGRRFTCGRVECGSSKVVEKLQRPVVGTHFFDDIKKCFLLDKNVKPIDVSRKLGSPARTTSYILKMLRENPSYKPVKKSRAKLTEIAEYAKNFSPDEAMEKFKISRDYYRLNARLGIFPEVKKLSNGRKSNPLEVLKLKIKVPHHKLRSAMISLSVPYKCGECGNDGRWMGFVLTLHIHHKNGNHVNNKIENLQFLCPNCHWITENHGGRNRKLLRLKRENS